MELFSDSTCCSHAWACYPTEMRYLVVTYMKSERTWTITMPLTWMLYIFLMVDDLRGSLIEIYIGLPWVFNDFLRFYFLNTTILQIYWVTKSASNVYRRRDVQLFSIFKHVLGLDKQDLTKMSKFHKMSFFSGFPHSKCVFSRLCE